MHVLRLQKQKDHGKAHRSEDEAGEPVARTEEQKQLLADSEALLDEIDGVLETNTEFVTQYVQRGGE